MRHIGGDVEEVARLDDGVVLEPPAVPDAGGSRRWRARGVACLWARARRPGGIVSSCMWIARAPADSAEMPTACREALLAGEGFAGAKLAAGAILGVAGSWLPPSFTGRVTRRARRIASGSFYSWRSGWCWPMLAALHSCQGR